MADDNDAVVAAASTIIVVDTARRRRRRKPACWARDWYLCSSMVTYIRLDDQKTYRNFCRIDTAEYDELLALVTPKTFDFVAGQYTLATESNSTRSTLSPKLNMFNSFDFVESGERRSTFCRTHVRRSRTSVHTSDKVEIDFVASIILGITELYRAATIG